eukprot:scaffold442_cov268-Pinguiococcus_pyrenoidosus.AAC.69
MVPFGFAAHGAHSLSLVDRAASIASADLPAASRASAAQQPSTSACATVQSDWKVPKSAREKRREAQVAVRREGRRRTRRPQDWSKMLQSGALEAIACAVSHNIHFQRLRKPVQPRVAAERIANTRRRSFLGGWRFRVFLLFSNI